VSFFKFACDGVQSGVDLGDILLASLFAILGGGAGMHFSSVDHTNRSGVTTTTRSESTGPHFIVGAGVPTEGKNRFFTELKLGFGDSPDMKVVAGWSFQPH